VSESIVDIYYNNSRVGVGFFASFDNKLFIVTAFHVVRYVSDGLNAFYQGQKIPVKLASTHGEDIALLSFSGGSISIPKVNALKCSSTMPLVGEDITVIVPHFGGFQYGKCKTIESNQIALSGIHVGPGCSGSPVITNQGVVGVISSIGKAPNLSGMVFAQKISQITALSFSHYDVLDVELEKIIRLVLELQLGIKPLNYLNLEETFIGTRHLANSFLPRINLHIQPGNLAATAITVLALKKMGVAVALLFHSHIPDTLKHIGDKIGSNTADMFFTASSSKLGQNKDLKNNLKEHYKPLCVLPGSPHVLLFPLDDVIGDNYGNKVVTTHGTEGDLHLSLLQRRGLSVKSMHIDIAEYNSYLLFMRGNERILSWPLYAAMISSTKGANMVSGMLRTQVLLYGGKWLGEEFKRNFSISLKLTLMEIKKSQNLAVMAIKQDKMYMSVLKSIYSSFL
jgi:hypothetical protein